MNKPLDPLLTPEKGLIFRVTHASNLPWILVNGLHCRSANVSDPNFISIGNPELIDLRARREVPIAPFGTLDDYIPFYFTPFTPMMYNIRTGWGGIRKRNNDEIIILVSSIHDLRTAGLKYVFTDRHAYLRTAKFYGDTNDLSKAVDYDLLRRRDFQRDPEDPEKVERYQAEALVHRHVPVSALTGIGCYSDDVRSRVEADATARNIALRIRVRREWYF